MYLYKGSKSGYYHIIYFNNGKRTSKSTKTKIKSEARKIFHEFIKQKEEESKKPRRKLKEYFDEYYNYHSPIRSKYYLESIKLSFNQLIKFTGDIYLDEIDVELVDKFISFTAKRTKSAAQLYYSTLKSAYSKAVLWGYTDSNPFKKTKAPKTKSKNPRFLSDEEFDAIIKNIGEKYLLDIYHLAFNTGMRAGELCSLKWHWIDFQRNIITVKNDFEFTTKSKRERNIPMTDRVRKILLDRFVANGKPQSERFVFWRVKDVRLNEDYINRKFKSAAVVAGFKVGVSIHTLRHSFASRLVQRGVSLFVVQKLLGHSTFRTTQIYSHLRNEDLRGAVSKLDDISSGNSGPNNLRLIHLGNLK
ncbi:tyrosine-type recombinase/integrase [Bacteroidota bacterium]